MARKYEGSKTDDKRDKAEAKKRGMSMKAWEGSPMDKKMDKSGQNKLLKKKK